LNKYKADNSELKRENEELKAELETLKPAEDLENAEATASTEK
jgi:cell division protein FtsB